MELQNISLFFSQNHLSRRFNLNNNETSCLSFSFLIQSENKFFFLLRTLEKYLFFQSLATFNGV